VNILQDIPQMKQLFEKEIKIIIVTYRNDQDRDHRTSQSVHIDILVRKMAPTVDVAKWKIYLRIFIVRFIWPVKTKRLFRVGTKIFESDLREITR